MVTAGFQGLLVLGSPVSRRSPQPGFLKNEDVPYSDQQTSCACTKKKTDTIWTRFTIEAAFVDAPRLEGAPWAQKRENVNPERKQSVKSWFPPSPRIGQPQLLPI
jgi:hypothetical protein